MLRTKLYTGLQVGEVKNAPRHKFDTGSTCDQLLVGTCTVELEYKSDMKAAKLSQAIAMDSHMGSKLHKVLKAVSTQGFCQGVRPPDHPPPLLSTTGRYPPLLAKKI